MGGTHAAGLGQNSFRHGSQADNCLGLEVVTGTGDLVWCTPETANFSITFAVMVSLASSLKYSIGLDDTALYPHLFPLLRPRFTLE